MSGHSRHGLTRPSVADSYTRTVPDRAGEAPDRDLRTEQLDALGRYGPFFHVTSYDVLPRGWTPVSGLSRDLARLDRRVDAVGRALGGGTVRRETRADVLRRVAASTALLGVCARLIAPVLAAAVDAVELDELYVKDELGGAFPLAVGANRPATAVGVLALVGPIVRTYRSTYSLSPILAWGNVASGLAGAARMIRAVDPAAGRRAIAFVRQTLAAPELADSGLFQDDGRFRRRSCCLIYRAGRPFCGDCVLSA